MSYNKDFNWENENISNFITDYFKKICEYVKADYNKIDFWKEDWFKLYSWTNQDEIDCEEWLIKYILNDNSLKKSLINKKRITKEDVKTFVEYFVFDFGWNSDSESLYIKRIKEKISTGIEKDEEM